MPLLKRGVWPGQDGLECSWAPPICDMLELHMYLYIHTLDEGWANMQSHSAPWSICCTGRMYREGGTESVQEAVHTYRARMYSLQGGTWRGKDGTSLVAFDRGDQLASVYIHTYIHVHGEVDGRRPAVTLGSSSEAVTEMSSSASFAAELDVNYRQDSWTPAGWPHRSPFTCAHTYPALSSREQGGSQATRVLAAWCLLPLAM